MMEFKVDGMTCGHCVKAVTKAVQAVSPGAHVEVHLSEKQVVVTGAVEREKVAAAIEAAGYKLL
ncbi:MAG: heavy-metal-associated domain-containing protein [Gammaproteobacteria bacterium]|nr:heavy-metal-associated domain-containing protein [Gammaproteobacteria bacterium]